MSPTERYERRLPTLLTELAAPRKPDYYDDIVGQVGRTRQRPGWTFAERWLPVSTITQRVAVAPRPPLRLIALAALVLLGLLAGLVLVAGTQHRVPAPFGIAANGVVAYADDSGAIISADLAGGTSNTIIPGPGNEHPVFSPDGTKLAYVYREGAGNLWVRVAAADGSSVTTLNDSPVSAVGYLGWSPDGATVVTTRQPVMLAYDALHGGEPSVMLMDLQGMEYDGGFPLTTMFRPPSGQEVLYLGRTATGGFGLYRRSIPDGEPVHLLTGQQQTIPFDDLGSPAWSPDGSEIALQVLAPGTDNDWRIYLMDADGSNVRRLTHSEIPGTLISEGNPVWSPDGTQIAMQPWHFDEAGNADTRPITVVDVATGEQHEVGTVNVNGYHNWGWSPDGKSILEAPSDPSPDADHILVVDATTGEVTRTGYRTPFEATWQRRAP